MHNTRTHLRLALAACGALLAVAAVAALGLPELAQAAPALLMLATAPVAIIAADPQAAYTAAGDAAYQAALAEGLSEGEAGAKARQAAADAQAAAEAAAADAAANKSTEPPAKRERMVKARVLADGPHGKANSVVSVPASVAKEADDLDASAAAVAYAESLQV